MYGINRFRIHATPTTETYTLSLHDALPIFEIQPKGGWIVISQMTAGELPEPEGTYIGVYSINDSGNVPPRWKIDGKPGTGMKKPHGIALNPNHKEVIVADMRLNAILTYYFTDDF